MAFFGLFGKKKQEEDIPVDIPGLGKEELGLPGLEETEGPAEQPQIDAPPGMGMPGFTGRQAMQQRPQQQRTDYRTEEREYEVLSAKLDSLRAILDSINQRLESLERIARGDHGRF